METKRSLQRRKRKTSMTKEELASAFGLGTSKFQCTADQLTENEVEKRRKVKMKKFSDMIQKSGNQEKPKARESPVKKRMFKITKRDDEQMLALALIENLQRSDLNPVEEAKGYRQLIDASGMTQEALSKAVSKSRSAITNSLRLLDLPEVVQQMIFEGKLTAGHARAILAVPYEDARINLAEKVVAEGLSVRATENLAPLFSAGETPKTPRPATPQSFKKAARVLRQVFNTNVRVKSSRGKNKIEIEFKDEEELSRILGEMIQFDQGDQDEE
jgi:ParB family chromosome partitioning protein